MPRLDTRANVFTLTPHIEIIAFMAGGRFYRAETSDRAVTENLLN